ncbi:hypothetical protein LV457_02915 [Mycobacterium sp. MYCO198283]|uniref:hypothetical protein n=1 Tax=Mycobacterium sp. MYCO198283 TaxID=2883505 RepID=UPI001E60ABD1|nr:hypothetical protein [Mycobacterium sp. MYCO198283]MCG5431241.1 hypothetical protein [Mycobacterium sp. MYCO198283]
MAKSNTAVQAVPDAPTETPEDLNSAVVTLEWKGETFTLPKRRGRWPIRAAREFGRENYFEAIIALIGEDGYDRLEWVCPYVDDINDFADYAGRTINTECVP